MKNFIVRFHKHILSIAITIGIILIGIFAFTNTLGRTVESFRDLGLSIAFFFCELFFIPHSITPTVTALAKIPFWGVSADVPTTFLPDNFQDFKTSWSAYWRLWASMDNFKAYLNVFPDVLFYICMGVLILLPFVVVLKLLINRYVKVQNNLYNHDTKPLRIFKRIALHVYHPIKRFVTDYIDFVRERKQYYLTWLLLFLWYFNVFTVLIEFIAYYFYFVIAFDVSTVYQQVYKLFIDLSVPFSFLPWWCWCIVAVVLLSVFARSIGYRRLRANEARNNKFISNRGVVTIVYGAMGVGKTTQITDMALSTEIQFRNTAFEIILKTDMQFPYFPWINLENLLRHAMYHRQVCDVPSVRKLIHKKRLRWKRSPCSQKLFGYDYERYGLTHNDNLMLIDVWQAIENYACAYFIYVIQSSLLLSNYSVRSDAILSDLGNFPLWDTDFFNRDPVLMDSYSRHAHILDFDMLRLGKRMIDENPNRNAFGFGVYIISEIDKERKNSKELMDKKISANADECNQKNDLFNILLKMSRHACVVDNKVFIKVFADLQRPSSLGADALELGEIINIVTAQELKPVLPFFSPFWLFNMLFEWLKPHFDSFYTQYRYNRADNTLFMHLFKTVVSKLTQYHARVNNLFGSQKLEIETEKGSRDGTVEQHTYYRMPKKIYSKRYCTDCLSGIFATRAEHNKIGLNDIPVYSRIMATPEELNAQNSHFQKEIRSLNYID